MLKIIQPLFISIIILYFNGSILKKQTLFYAVVISLISIVCCIFHHLYFFNTWRIGMKIRLAVSGLLYRKLFRMNTKSLDSKLSNEIISHLSIDATHLEISVLYLPYLIIGIYKTICYSITKF